MDRMRFPPAVALGMAMLIGPVLSAPPAQAGHVVTLTQQEGDVVATGSGPIDLTGLSFFGAPANINDGLIVPSTAFINFGSNGGPQSIYTGFTGPASFGSGSGASASSAVGDLVGIVGGRIPIFSDITFLVVPSGYVSDSPLSDTATFAGQTLTSLGATTGKYEWTWGTGANQNFTLEIAAVPEPGTWALLLTGFAVLGAMMRSRRRMAIVSI
jgi:hypothetical protein